jgi:hypothetical protein
MKFNSCKKKKNAWVFKIGYKRKFYKNFHAVKEGNDKDF